MSGPRTRRRALRDTVLGTVSLLALPLPVAAVDRTTSAPGRLKVVVLGGHPDDPETMAGGTLALSAAQGHDVVCLYLTRGEAGIPGR